jgi:cytoskeletal protein RodZ
LTQSIGSFLKSNREQRKMSLEEVARVTRIPTPSLESIEADRFDELPGEVFVRGFLKSYAHAVGVVPAEVLARYTSSRRLAFVTPLPIASPVQAVRQGNGRRFGVAIAFVLLLILFTLALSIVLKPRGHDVPAELSQRSCPRSCELGSDVSSA